MYIKKLKDNSYLAKNPFINQIVYYPSGRDKRPILNLKIENKKQKEKILNCPFCKENILKTTPERSRIIKNDKEYEIVENLSIENVLKKEYLFRTISNLYEIVPFSYWNKKYNYSISKELLNIKNSYIKKSDGKNHLIKLAKDKLSLFENNSIKNEKELLEYSNSFYATLHDVIIVNKHFIDQKNNQIFNMNNFSLDEITLFNEYSIFNAKKIFNRFNKVKYVSIFNNFLENSGASIDHFHRQVLAVDFFGNSFKRKLKKDMIKKYLDFLIKNNLKIFENDLFVVVSEIGHIYPTIGIYFKNRFSILKLTKDDLKNLSCILKKIYSFLGNSTPYNEEWFYSPINLKSKIPFHINITIRINKEGGFERTTGILVNPIDFFKLKENLIKEI